MTRHATTVGSALVAAVALAAACGDDLGQRQAGADGGGIQRPDGGDEIELPVCVEQSGHACTWLGMPGMFGFNGDGHHRLLTEIYWSMDMTFAPDGTPWFIDWNNHLIRKVLPDQTVATVVGWTDPIFPGDGPGDTSEKSPDGADGQLVKLNHPTDFAIAPDDSILVMAWHNHKLRQIDVGTERVRILSGGGAGFAGDGLAAASALYKQPRALDIDEDGNLYILDQQNFRIRKLDATTGTMSTIAGTGTAGYAGDGGPAAAAQLRFEAGSNPEPSGGMAYKAGKLYVADGLNNRIRVIDLALGTINLVAGDGVAGYSGDGGPALTAQLANPKDLEFGPDGDLYIADTDNNVIRAIEIRTGNIRTVAGTGELGLDPEDGKLATSTRLARPFGIQFDPEGNLYIMDTINSRILKVSR